MDYNDTVNWMFSQLPIYQNKGKSAYKADLSNSIKLDNHLNNPHRAYKTIHVGGTNGKGSTSHIIASVLQESGYKVGLYTSPHLKDFRERIRINGEEITQSYVVDFITKHKPFFEDNQLSFFEMTVGLAFSYFKDQDVDFAVIEVGLGGRLDSTNIITPILSIITNIGYDHTDILGKTLDLIAKEKAGIIKPETPVVIGETHSKTEPVFRTTAKFNNSEIFFADNLEQEQYKTDLKGKYQVKNVKTALESFKILKILGLAISDSHIKKGLSSVVKNTQLKGRWQQLSANPKIICDTAHNIEGLQEVFNQIKNENFKKLHIVFGTLKGKDLDNIIPLLPNNAIYYLCAPKIPRSLPLHDLVVWFSKFNLNFRSFNSVNEALSEAKEISHPDDFIFVGGSTFVVSEII